MRISVPVIGMASLMVTASGMLSASHAQSFFQQLFGGGGASEAAASRPVPSLKSFSRVSPYGSSITRSAPEGVPSQSYGGGGSGGGSYRTLCVRTCDGYYWPISASASQTRLHQDARQCQTSCNTEARMFYLPRSSGDIANMVDLQGRAYGRLPTAFAYRTSLMAGCSCRPMPWSAAEAVRHDGYRVVATLERERLAASTASTAPVPAPKIPQPQTAKAAATASAAPAVVAAAEAGQQQGAEHSDSADPPLSADMPLELAAGASRSYATRIPVETPDQDAAETPQVASANEGETSEMVVTSETLSPVETPLMVAAAEPDTAADTDAAPTSESPDRDAAPSLPASSDVALPGVVDVAEREVSVTEPIVVAAAEAPSSVSPDALADPAPDVIPLATAAPWQPAIAARMGGDDPSSPKPSAPVTVTPSITVTTLPASAPAAKPAAVAAPSAPAMLDVAPPVIDTSVAGAAIAEAVPVIPASPGTTAEAAAPSLAFADTASAAPVKAVRADATLKPPAKKPAKAASGKSSGKAKSTAVASWFGGGGSGGGKYTWPGDAPQRRVR